MTDSHPFASSFRDRHGKVRWRFRRRKKTISLPGCPGEPEFEAAYQAALTGRPIKRAEVRRLPGATTPKSLRAAWRIVTTKTTKWKTLRGTSKAQQIAVAERFLTTKVEGLDLVYGDVLVEDIKRRHVNALLSTMADKPHAAAMVLRALKKMILAALDEEWIEVDPTYGLQYRPDYTGWRAWTAAERRRFEAHWSIGTTPRLAYALALYTGLRRADIATLRWDMIDGDGLNVVQSKTGRALWLPILPELAEALDAAPRRHKAILVTQYGSPFSIKSLGMRMQEWTRAAGLPPGATMHGLRKTLAKLLAEGGATTRQLMDVLGHTDIQHAELYTREAEQKLLARAAMKRLKTSG